MKKILFFLLVAPLPAFFGASEVRGADSIPRPLSFTAPGKGFVSLGVYNAQGQMIRNLVSAESVEAGKQTVIWDGTTQLGLAAEPGKYTVRGIWFPRPPQSNHVMKVGVSGNPPWMTSDDRGSWGGNLGPPMGICGNNKNLLEIFTCVEGGKMTGIQLMDFDGNILHRFASFFPWDVRLASVMDEQNAYIAIRHGSKNANRLIIGKYDLDSPPRGKILCDVPAGNHYEAGGLWKGRWTAEVQGLALTGGRLYVPVKLDDKVFVVDTADGKILGDVTVPSPRGMAVRDGEIFAVSGKNIVSLNPDGSIAGSPIISGLDDPAGLAFDTAGNFYVADRGETQQVRVFSPVGEPLREIGIRGGRPRNGIYNPAGLLDPRSVWVAPDGRVWVASDAEDFQETTAWDSSGKRVLAFYNIRWSSGLGRLSPDRNEMLAGFPAYSDAPGLTAYEIDWKKATWTPSWRLEMTPDLMRQDNAFLGHTHIYDQPAVAYGRAPYLGFENGLVKGDNGKSYLVGGDFSIWLFDETTKQPKLASFVYMHRVHQNSNGIWEGDYDRGPNNWLTWADLNGDGKMATDEITVVENQPLLQNVSRIADNGWQLQADLSIVMLAYEKVTGAWNIYRLPPRKILPSGAPIYNWADLAKVVTLEIPDFKGGDGYKAASTIFLSQMRVEGDFVSVHVNPVSNVKLRLAGIDGDGWWASRNWRTTPMKFDLKTGQPAWLKLGSRAAGKAKPGQMYYPGWGIAGSVAGVNFIADTMGQVWQWTNDGLFLGCVYNEDKSLFDQNGLFVELTGAFVYDIGGKTYVLAGDHGVSIHEIDMPKLTPIEAGTVTITPEIVAHIKPWDPDGPTPGKKPVHIARSIFDYDSKNPVQIRTIAVDGTLDPAEWEGVAAMELFAEGKKIGTVQLTFDKENLYLAYRIEDANGLKNDGHELPYAPYVSGSYVDFVIGPDWTTPNRTELKEGDIRVILARINGAKPFDYQMGFWPVKKELRRFAPKPKELNPQTIASPAQQRNFDDISPVSGLQFAYQVSDKGYTLEVKAPFASLGINPVRSPVVGFDASVGFADPSGQIRINSVHWAGESEAMVVDRPGSTELKPVTWGTLQFDRNPLGK